MVLYKHLYVVESYKRTDVQSTTCILGLSAVKLSQKNTNKGAVHKKVSIESSWSQQKNRSGMSLSMY